MRVFQHAIQKRFGVAVVSALIVLAMSITAPAAIIPLSGGDSDNGWVAPAPSLLKFAYNLADVDRTIQSVLFDEWANPGVAAPTNPAGIVVTATANGTNPYGAPSYPLPTANDTAMAEMIRNIFYSTANSGAGPLTFTMSNLTPNALYRIDLFTYSGDLTRTNNYSYNGNSPDGATWIQTAGVSYLVQNTIAANGSGQIILNISIPNPTASNLNPILSGMAVSLVPEPSAIVLIGLGAAITVVRGRRRLSK